MYTATLQKAEVVKGEGKVNTIVEITDGVTTFTKSFVVGLREPNVLAKVAQQAKHFIEGLENADAAVAAVPLGVLDLASVPTTIATQAELDRNAWIINYNRLLAASKMVELGIFTDTQPQYVALKNKVAADFKPAYLNFI